MSISRVIFCLLLSLGIPSLYASEIVINEVMASNITTQIDPDKSDFGDWIELYNVSGEIIHLGGIYVTDDLSNPFKWQLPIDVPLHPNAYYIIWADGQDYENHTSFKLSGIGEQIGVYNPDGRIMDTLTFGMQRDDISFGRFPNAGNEWHYFTDPTCEGANITSGLVSSEQASPPAFTPEGGFYSGNQLISMAAEAGTTIRYTTDGSIPTDISPEYTGPISLDGTAVFRARGFQENFLPSDVVTCSYVIDEPATFPVISIATPPEFLFDEEIGITVGICKSDLPGEPPPFDMTANFWNRWERPVHIEYFTPEG
ncbi:MAG: chitobiase/beta-hexosaminidase C-terminal domain-containing protein, partial [Bacteroidales bacterium]|nr:chitobiase/beta-hexosaminidase C-terminal domain-containing protein [Bacteroidales bacterium]